MKLKVHVQARGGVEVSSDPMEVDRATLRKFRELVENPGRADGLSVARGGFEYYFNPAHVTYVALEVEED